MGEGWHILNILIACDAEEQEWAVGCGVRVIPAHSQDWPVVRLSPVYPAISHPGLSAANTDLTLLGQHLPKAHQIPRITKLAVPDRLLHCLSPVDDDCLPIGLLAVGRAAGVGARRMRSAPRHIVCLPAR